MRISHIIAEWQRLQTKLGDVEIVSEKDDGRSTWVSPYRFKVTVTHGRYMHSNDGY